MTTNLTRVTSGLALITAMTLWAPGAYAPALAATTVDPSALIPPPPAEFNPVCKGVGDRTICDVTFTEPPVVASPIGLQCATGADAFEVLDSSTRSVDGKRFYNAAGKLTERHFHDVVTGTLTNSRTGASVPYSQHDTTMHVLAVAGDISTGTEALAVHIRFATADGGTVLIDTGRTVLAESDGTILFDAGQHPLDEFFVFGQASALDPVCEALQ